MTMTINSKFVGNLLFLTFFIIYELLSIYIAVGMEIYHNDAISRTALGFFTVFGRNPHLAAVGFVWTPLPSLAQIPFLIALKQLDLMMLAGPLVTSIAGAVSVLMIYKIGLLLQKTKKHFIPLLIAILFGINPLIALYASLGTSEAIFIASLLACSYYFIKWFYQTRQFDLVFAGFFIMLSFWSRYEALPAFIAFSGLVLLKGFVDKFTIKKTLGSFLIFTVPFLYTIFLWIYFNWTIMKDPFYFLHSPYSNTAFTGLFQANPSLPEGSYHSLTNSFAYMVKRSLYLAPILAMLLLLPYLLWRKVKNKTHDFALVLLLTFPYLSILLFHVYQLYKGESFGWLRFHIYAIIGGSLLAFYISRKNKLLAYISITLLVIGIITSGYAMTNHELGREEESFMLKFQNNAAVLDYSRTYYDQKRVAKLMDTLEGEILLDTDKGFAIPLFSKNPERYIITSDIDYLHIVKTYPKYVNWIILPKPAADDRGQNIIYTYYPKIWEGKAPSISLYKEVAGWRIYKVGKG